MAARRRARLSGLLARAPGPPCSASSGTLVDPDKPADLHGSRRRDAWPGPRRQQRRPLQSRQDGRPDADGIRVTRNFPTCCAVEARAAPVPRAPRLRRIEVQRKPAGTSLRAVRVGHAETGPAPGRRGGPESADAPSRRRPDDVHAQRRASRARARGSGQSMTMRVGLQSCLAYCAGPLEASVSFPPAGGRRGSHLAVAARPHGRPSARPARSPAAHPPARRPA